MADYTIEKQNNCLHLTLAGNLTASIAASLQTAVREAIGTDVTEVVADLRNTVMLDSSGIGFLIATSNSLSRRGGRIRVINVSADILQLLQGMRLTQRLNASGRAA